MTSYNSLPKKNNHEMTKYITLTTSMPLANVGCVFISSSNILVQKSVLSVIAETHSVSKFKKCTYICRFNKSITLNFFGKEIKLNIW